MCLRYVRCVFSSTCLSFCLWTSLSPISVASSWCYAHELFPYSSPRDPRYVMGALSIHFKHFQLLARVPVFFGGWGTCNFSTTNSIDLLGVGCDCFQNSYYSWLETGDFAGSEDFITLCLLNMAVKNHLDRDILTYCLNWRLCFTIARLDPWKYWNDASAMSQ